MGVSGARKQQPALWSGGAVRVERGHARREVLPPLPPPPPSPLWVMLKARPDDDDVLPPSPAALSGPPPPPPPPLPLPPVALAAAEKWLAADGVIMVTRRTARGSGAGVASIASSRFTAAAGMPRGRLIIESVNESSSPSRVCRRPGVVPSSSLCLSSSSSCFTRPRSMRSSSMRLISPSSCARRSASRGVCSASARCSSDAMVCASTRGLRARSRASRTLATIPGSAVSSALRCSGGAFANGTPVEKKVCAASHTARALAFCSSVACTAAVDNATSSSCAAMIRLASATCAGACRNGTSAKY